MNVDSFVVNRRQYINSAGEFPLVMVTDEHREGGDTFFRVFFAGLEASSSEDDDDEEELETLSAESRRTPEMSIGS